MAANTKFLASILFVTLLTGCVIEPINSSSVISTSTPTSVSTSEQSSLASSDSEVISSATTSDSVNSSAESSSEGSISSEESSLNPTVYFDVLDIQTNFNATPKSATIYVRLSGEIITQDKVIQGAWLIANDFYQHEFNIIQTTRVELRINFYNSTQDVIDEPSFGYIDFVINESETLLGIQLLTEGLIIQ